MVIIKIYKSKKEEEKVKKLKIVKAKKIPFIFVKQF